MIDSHSIDISFGKSMFCSMLAGAMASTITNPLDMAKLRLQVQRANAKQGAGSFYYRNMLHALWHIGKDEGIMALFRGTIARMMFHIPMTAIAMSVVE